MVSRYFPGIYVNVLRVLGMVDDLGMIAEEDAIGRRLQNEALPHRKGAPRRKPLELEIDA